jgi:hypothetical protein
MAFDFLGTFKRSEFDRLITYAEAQLQYVDPRISYLKSEIDRLGWIEYEFDEEGHRVSYVVRPRNSVLAKYARAFEYYGGNLTDLQIRSRGDWIYMTKGKFSLKQSEPFAGGVPSEGEYQKGNQSFDDTAPSNTVSKVKDWMIPNIKRRVEDLEFRIKRTVDLTDQHIEEIVLLVKRKSGAETLDDLKQEVAFYVSSEDFPSVTDE